MKMTVVPVLCLALLVVPRSAAAVEEAAYEVLDGEGPMELRRYDPQVLVETRVTGSFGRAGDVAFGRLFRYISGANRPGVTIEMTSPVAQRPAGTRIDMTAPVTQAGDADGWTVAFLLPARFDSGSAPAPTDPTVELRSVPERTVAAIRFSGTWREARFDAAADELRGWMSERGLEAAGPPVVARYDPPYTPWFMRRNEVLIPVTVPPVP